MRQRHDIPTVLISAIAAVGSVSGPALAAPAVSTAAADPNDNSVGEIMVTAQRYAEPLSKLGQTVEAITSADINTLDIKQTQDLAHVVPAFQATTSGDSGAPIYSLRGVGFATQNIGSTAPVGVYIDEVAYPYPMMALGETFDLQRVEVLYGPQGTLYGRNTTGGLVDYVTGKPTSTPEGSITAGLGNYSSWESNGYLSGPIGTTLKGRIAFDSENRDDGWQHSITRNDTLGTLHRNSLRGILEWTPTEKFTVTATASMWERTGDTQAAQAMGFIVGNQSPLAFASVQTHPTPTSADWVPASDQPQSSSTGFIRPADTNNDHFGNGTLKLAYQIDDELSIVSLTNYNHLNANGCFDFAGVQVEQTVQCSTAEIHTISEEARVVGEYGKSRVTAGLYFGHDNVTEFAHGYAGELGTILGLRQFGLYLQGLGLSKYTTEQINTSYRLYGQMGDTLDTVKAVFVNGATPLSDTFKLTVGGRYTRDSVSFFGAGQEQQGNNVALINTVFPALLKNPNLGLVVPNGSYSLNADNTGFAYANESQTQNNFAFRTNLDWTPTANSLYYALIARGFKSGLFPTLAASTVNQLTPVSQEQLTDYEVGAKLSMLDDRVKLNGSLFYYDYKNRQVYGSVADAIFGTLPRVVNIPKSTSKGFNGDLMWRVTNALTARAGISWVEATIKEYTGYNELGAIQNFSGEPVPFSPKVQAFGSLVQQVPLTADLGLDIGLDGSYQSQSYGYIGGLSQFAIAPYGLLNGSLTLHNADSKWMVTAYGRNLADRYYWTTAELSHDSFTRFAGMPRTYGIRFTWKFL